MTKDIDPFTLEEAHAERADKARFESEIEIGDLKWLMSNKRGRRFVYRMLERAGVWRLSFSTNALSMAFAEGTRNEGLRLLAQITEHCLDRYAEMLREQKE
jgi:hypothetical protein